MNVRESLFARFERELVDLEHSTFDGVIKRVPHFQSHKPVRDINKEFKESFSPLDRLAIFVTDRVGTFGFFLIILAWTVGWLGWNALGPVEMRYDPPPAFVLWLFISNVIQITLMPLIMIGQNLQGRHAALRAEADFEVNLRAEKEIEVILLHLEHQAAQIERHGELILEILKRLREGQEAKTETISG